MRFVPGTDGRPLPLTAKLTLWNTLVVLLVAIVALISVREGLRLMLLKELETALDAEAFEIALSASHSPTGSQDLFDKLAETSAGHIRRGWFLQLFNAQGDRILWSSGNTPEIFTTTPFSSHADFALQAGETYQFSESEVLNGQESLYRLRVGAPLTFIQEDVGNVTRILTPVLGVVFLLAPVGGYLLAQRATRPLQKIISASRELHPTRLDERLPLRDTGDELDQLSAEINHFLDQIADYLKHNRDFVANAAHELRSPLTALMTSVDVALSRPRSAAEYDDLLATVQEECRRLADLANQLLLLAESDAGLLGNHVSPVALDSVVRSAVEMFTGVAEDKGVRLSANVPGSCLIMADTIRIRQVVHNLIDNAIKFTPAGGTVMVTLDPQPAQSLVWMDVTDNGIGIPPESRSHIFERFYQVESSRQHTENPGFGLGLSICRSIVQAYGGSLTLEPPPNDQGARFRMEIPLAPNAVAG